MRKYLSLFVTLLVICFVSCQSSSSKKAKKKVTIAMVNWIECVANTHLAKVVLEDRGYDVDVITADVAPVFAAVSRGNADLFMEVWEPITHKPYMEKFGENVERIGTVYNDGQLGLVVPSYVDINSIEELNGHKEAFDGKIVGIDAGAGMMKLTQKAIEDYDLDLQLMASSEAGMLAALKKAYDKKEWVVVTGWKPHTKFAKFDLKMLQDPKTIMGKKETISVIATKGWKEKNPELATFFENFKMDDQLLGSLMVVVEANPGNTDEACREWYGKHKDVVNSWFNSK